MTLPGSSVGENLRWAAAAQIGKLATQLGAIAVLARLLPPSAFGLLAMATIVTNLAMIFRDPGSTIAIIQRKDITSSFLGTAHTTNIAIGLITAAIVAGTAPIIAIVFDSPVLTTVLLVLCLVFPVTAAGTTSLALLERGNRFRAIASIEIASSLIGFVAAIAFSVSGLGVISLALQLLVTSATSTLFYRFLSNESPRMEWRIEEFRSLWSVGGNILAFNITNYCVRNSDAFLIGRILGEAALGWYSIASRVLLFPIQNLTFVISRALFPTYSREQENRVQLSAMYVKTLVAITALAAPLMFGIWALREPLVSVVLGDEWGPVVGLMAWLAPMGFFQSLSSTTGTILAAIGRVDVLKRLGLLTAAVILGGFLIGIRYGLVGVVIGYFVATIISVALSIQVTMRQLTSSITVLLPQMAAPLFCTFLMTAVVCLCEVVAQSHFSDFPRLILATTLGVMSYGLFLSLFCRELVRELWSVVSGSVR